MKFFGRKPSAQAAAASTLEQDRLRFEPPPLSTQRMLFALHECTTAELSVITRQQKAPEELSSSYGWDARYDVVLQASQSPLGAEWTLSPAQARELAARLLFAAEECSDVVNAVYAPRRD